MRRFLLTIGMVYASAGCAGRTAPPAAPAVAPPSMAGLTLLLDGDAKVVGSQSACASYGGRMRELVEESLLRAGFVVVTDPSAPHDATVAIEVRNLACANFGDGWVSGTFRLAVANGGTLVDSEEVTPSDEGWSDSNGGAYRGGSARALSTQLVRQLIAAPTFAAFASQRHHTNESAVASAPPAAVPSSSPSAAAPAQPPPGPAPSSMSLLAGAPQPTTYALVVGIERYQQSFPPPTGARSDAMHIADLVRRTFGVPDAHLKVALDDQATKGSLDRDIEWLRTSVPDGGSIVFYFSGHGAPNASDGTPYLMPFDGDPQYLDQTATTLASVIQRLSATKARQVFAVIDSCFSGEGGRSVLPPGARPLTRVKEQASQGGVAVFTAATGNEITGPTADGTSGLFTSFVLQGLGTGAADIDGNGQVTLGELGQWVGPRVTAAADAQHRPQHPNLVVGSNVSSPSAFVVEWGLPTH